MTFTEGPPGTRNNASRHWIIKSRKIRRSRIVHGTFQECHDIQRHRQMSCDPGAKDFAAETLRAGLELAPSPGQKQLALPLPLPRSRQLRRRPTTILLYAFNRPLSGCEAQSPPGYSSVFAPSANIEAPAKILKIHRKTLLRSAESALTANASLLKLISYL